MSNVFLFTEAKAWVKRKNGPDEIVQIVPNLTMPGEVTAYELYTAYDKLPDYLGRILFDSKGYWIYDGEHLNIEEQEQIGKFIINYVEAI